MPRQIYTRMTLDDIEEEILYTRAALRADPDAKDLLPMTDTWFDMVDTTRKKERRAREVSIDADACRGVCNARLDAVCTQFSTDLNYALNNNRKSARYTQFFKNPVSRFVRQALTTQISMVNAWLENSNDAVLLKHKPELQRWCRAAMSALEDTAATAVIRGQAWLEREKLAEDLTRERDGLQHALMGKAQELGLNRDWPNVFFRSVSSKRDKSNVVTTNADTQGNDDNDLSDNDIHDV